MVIEALFFFFSFFFFFFFFLSGFYLDIGSCEEKESWNMFLSWVFTGNLKILLNNSFNHVFLNLFLKISENNFYLFPKIIFYFILFVKIVSKEYWSNYVRNF